MIWTDRIRGFFALINGVAVPDGERALEVDLRGSVSGSWDDINKRLLVNVNSAAASVHLTGRTAAISTTTLVTPTSSKMYAVHAQITRTTAGSSGASATLHITTTSHGVSVEPPGTGSSSLVVNLETHTHGSVIFYVRTDANTPLRYAVDYNGAGSPVYAIDIDVFEMSPAA